MNPRFRALHIGDLHFWDIPLNPFAYAGKRLLGVGNLVVGRRMKKFRTSMGHLLTEKLNTLKPAPDTILFSGDFSSTSLPAEFRQANDLFCEVINKSHGGAHSVPGNHDCYTRWALATGLYRKSLAPAFNPEKSISFLEIAEGAVTLLRINATTINGLLGCHGEITSGALGEIESGLRHVRTSHLWILCHFPAEDPKALLPRDRGEQLRGARPLLDLLAGHDSKKLWLHGHHHHRWLYGSPTVRGLVYVNAGAPLMAHGKLLPDLGFHELILEEEVRVRTHVLGQEGSRWHCLDPDLPGAGEWVDLQREELAGA